MGATGHFVEEIGGFDAETPYLCKIPEGIDHQKEAAARLVPDSHPMSLKNTFHVFGTLYPLRYIPFDLGMITLIAFLMGA